MDIVVNVNIEAGGEKPKVEVNKDPIKRKPVMKQTKRFGGVLQFPAPKQSSGVLDMLGIKET
jgi:hypothetical protein